MTKSGIILISTVQEYRWTLTATVILTEVTFIVAKVSMLRNARVGYINDGDFQIRLKYQKHYQKYEIVYNTSNVSA